MTPSLANEINYTLYDRFIISFGTILRQSNSDFVTGSLDLSELLVKKKNRGQTLEETQLGFFIASVSPRSFLTREESYTYDVGNGIR